ncbi:MAG: hypothetical protein HRF45_06435 [Fimbriimonadia bacterium]|jgi:hypothetical protein
MSESISEPWALHVLSTCRYLQSRLEQTELMATLGYGLNGSRTLTPLSDPRACVEMLEELSGELTRLVRALFGNQGSAAPPEEVTRARLRVLIQGLRDEADAELLPQHVAKHYGSPPPQACERLQRAVDSFGAAATRLASLLADRGNE